MTAAFFWLNLCGSFGGVFQMPLCLQSLAHLAACAIFALWVLKFHLAPTRLAGDLPKGSMFAILEQEWLGPFWLFSWLVALLLQNKQIRSVAIYSMVGCICLINTNTQLHTVCIFILLYHIECCAIYGLDDLCQKIWLQHAIRAKNTSNGIVQSSKAPKPQNPKVTFQSTTYIYHITLNLKTISTTCRQIFHTLPDQMLHCCAWNHTQSLKDLAMN